MVGLFRTGTIRSGHRAALKGMLAMVVAWMSPTLASAQGPPCPPTTVEQPSQSAVITLESESTPVCTLEPGGYVRLGEYYRLHSVASVGGSCQIYVQNYYCWPAYIEARTIGYTEFLQNPQNPVTVGIVSTNRPFGYNSHVTGETSGPPQWVATPLGEVTINSQTAATTTACNFSGMFPPQQPITVNVVECGPDWRTNPYDAIKRFATDSSPQTNYVYVPESLRGTRLDDALQDAIDGLNPILSDAEIPQRFERTVDFDMCSNPQNRAHCIQMVAGSPLGGACSSIFTPDNPDGTIMNVSTMTIGTGWTSWNDAFLQRSINHELTHGLGIDNNDCAFDKSLMTEITCGQVVGSNTLPTINELSAIAKTIYGGGTRQVCF